ncbi:MAG: hypothetical protein GY953_05225 [bacterium]|nr:hypothetical protein [bacterium]
MKQVIPLSACLVLSFAPASADVSFRQEAKVTGGVAKGAMKVAGVFSKQAREPMVSETVVSGHLMAYITGPKTIITDLNNRRVTEVDNKRKRYSSYTFDQRRQYMEKLAVKAKKKSGNNPRMEIRYTVTVDKLDETQEFDGKPAKAYRVKVAVDPASSQGEQPAGMFDVTMKTYMVEPIENYSELTEFHRRMAEEMKWLPNSGLGGMANVQPAASQNMSDVWAEVAKLQGMPVFQQTTMGAAGTPPPQQGQASATPSEDPPAEQEDQSLRGSLRKGLGGLRGFGRKKKNNDRDKQQAQRQPGAGAGTFMELEIRYFDYSNAPVDRAKLDTEPAGFKRMKSDIEKALD